jgi:FMN-dependent NADH-azoreductase
MTKLLYVTCNLKPVDVSRSLSTGKVFLDEYRRLHPDDEIQSIDLYRHDIQRIDTDVLSGWGKLRSGQGPDSLTAEEKRKIDRLWAHAGHFASFDRYVFVTPMWNLSFPAEVKMYIDAICIAGQTFQYSATGPVGLLKGKKCLNINSSGGFHSGKEDDHSVPYLKSIMRFLGVDDFSTIVIEGVDAQSEREQEFRKLAADQAVVAAARF